MYILIVIRLEREREWEREMESTSTMHYCTLPRRHKKRATGIIHVYVVQCF